MSKNLRKLRQQKNKIALKELTGTSKTEGEREAYNKWYFSEKGRAFKKKKRIEYKKRKQKEHQIIKTCRLNDCDNKFTCHKNSPQVYCSHKCRDTQYDRQYGIYRKYGKYK